MKGLRLFILIILLIIFSLFYTKLCIGAKKVEVYKETYNIQKNETLNNLEEPPLEKAKKTAISIFNQLLITGIILVILYIIYRIFKFFEIL